MQIIARGRNVEVPDHFRDHVADKLTRLERYDGKIITLDVELHHERNPRQNDSCQRVEITCRTRGPVVRAEACAGDFYSALDIAVDRLDRRLRQAADRRRQHHGRRAAPSVRTAGASSGLAASGDAATVAVLDRAATHDAATAGASDGADPTGATAAATGATDATAVDGSLADPVDDDGTVDDDPWAPVDSRPGQIVREKEHPGRPMSVDQALEQMELVGHDFFLFHDEASGRPSVVYRRHAFDYGIIRLT